MLLATSGPLLSVLVSVGDLVPPPAHPAPAPPHPPTAYPGMEPVPHPTPLNSYTSHQVGESSSTQQMPAGNFWETVMVSVVL